MPTESVRSGTQKLEFHDHFAFDDEKRLKDTEKKAAARARINSPGKHAHGAMPIRGFFKPNENEIPCHLRRNLTIEMIN